jgi:hypothetical protein
VTAYKRWSSSLCFGRKVIILRDKHVMRRYTGLYNKAMEFRVSQNAENIFRLTAATSSIITLVLRVYYINRIESITITILDIIHRPVSSNL